MQADPGARDGRSELPRRSDDVALQRLRTVLGLADVSVWWLDVEHRRLHFDLRASGWAPDGGDPVDAAAADGLDLDGYLNTMHPDDLDVVLRTVLEMVPGGPPTSLMLRQRRPDGRWRHGLTRFVARTGPGGRAGEVVGVSMDVSELARAQALNAQLLERLRVVAEAVGVGFWSREPLVANDTGDAPDAADGRAATPDSWHWDDSMFRLYGLTRGGPTPSPQAFAEQHVHPDDHPRWWRHAGGDEDVGAPVRVRRGGVWRWVQMRSHRVERDGRTQVHGMHVDVTEQHEAEALAAARRQAEARNRAKSEFLASISHELRTPLNAILGFTQLMRSDAGQGAAQRDAHLGRIDDAGRLLLSMVDRMLEIGVDDGRLSSWLETSPPRPSPPGAEPVRRGAQVRLLCAEDNDVNAMLLHEIVALRPHIDMRLAADGASALREAAAFEPHVFLLDMHLPDINGTELMRRLRGEPRHAGARWIALSANAMPADVDAALAAGFDRYWTKPIDIAALLAALDELADSVTATSPAPRDG